MVAVALVSAFIAMRLAIHGREAVVPELVGLTVADAGNAASSKGLNLTLENHFYSSVVPAGRVLAQNPPAGSRVRREWPVRITESLGGQRVSIPDLTGESERAATVSIRRLSLDLGVVAHLAMAGDPDVVIAQTPPVNSAGGDGPRVSLLVSDPSAETNPSANSTQAQAYVMPSLLGLTYSTASERAAAASLHLVLTPDVSVPAATSPASAAALTPPPSPGPPPTTGTIASQWPQPGRRVVPGDAVHITLSHAVAAWAP